MRIVDLIPAAAGDCEALGTCTAGYVVGAWENHGFRWSPPGTLEEILPLVAVSTTADPGTTCRALAVNDAGVVVGVSDAWQGLPPDASDVQRAFRWDPSVSPLAVDLGTLIPDPNNPGGFIGNSVARAINNNGWIVGVSDTAHGDRHACVWLPTPDPVTGRTVLDLGTLTYDLPTSRYLGSSEATAVNDGNVVVGASSTTDGNGQPVRRGFDWSPSTQAMRPFGTFAAVGQLSVGNSSANAINWQGDVVGGADYFAGNVLATRAWRCSAGWRQLHSLPLFIGPNIVATGINSNAPATIVGYYGVGPSILTTRAFVYTVGAGNLTDLTGTLGLITPWVVHMATGINYGGQITGIATNPLATGTVPRAVLIEP